MQAHAFGVIAARCQLALDRLHGSAVINRPTSGITLSPLNSTADLTALPMSMLPTALPFEFS